MVTAGLALLVLALGAALIVVLAEGMGPGGGGPSGRYDLSQGSEAAVGPHPTP